MEFRLISINGRPQLAIPIGPGALRRAAARRYQPTSPRKKVFRSVFDAAGALGLDSVLGRRVSNPLGPSRGFEDFSLERFLEAAREHLAAAAIEAAVVWPAREDRGRIYVHLLEPSGTPLAFCKMSAREHDPLLTAEENALRTMRSLNLKRSYQPAVLASGTAQGKHYLMLEAIPDSARMVRMEWERLREIADEFGAPRRRVLSAAALCQTPWWRRAMAARDEMPHVIDLVERAAETSGLPVQRIHGDLGCHNLVRVGQTHWLFDWEHASDAGPCLADAMNYWLGARQRTILKNPVEGFRRLAAAHLGPDAPHRPAEVAAALAYLHAAGTSTARLLAPLWPTRRPCIRGSARRVGQDVPCRERGSPRTERPEHE